MSQPRGRTPLEGACNRLMDVGMFDPYYCHRPATGDDGLCNIHRGADKRGQQNRERAAQRARTRREMRRSKP